MGAEGCGGTRKQTFSWEHFFVPLASVIILYRGNGEKYLNLPCQLSRGHLGGCILVNFTTPQGGNVIPILEERSALPNIPTTSLLLNQD